MSGQPEQKLTKPQKNALIIKEALGKIGVLAVGVTDYLPASGFDTLKKCSNDAAEVALAFRETPQLNADPAFLKHLTSATTATPPTRGLILHHLKELSAGARKEDRILFYFSGHGHRISGDDSLYLVPQDAYDETAAEAMVSLDAVLKILRESEARQKIVVLDACLSGPTLLGKKLHAASYSNKFLAEYIAGTKGVAILSSSEVDQASYEKSNHPKLSLFTSILIPALRGAAPDALDTQFLTLPSLFDYLSVEVKRTCKSFRLNQAPAMDGPSVGGVIVLGDFRQTLVPNSPIDFKKHPISWLIFTDSQSEFTSSILTHWRNRTLTVDQLTYAANQGLEEYLEQDFGRFRSALRNKLNFSVSELESNGASLIFPGGSLSYRFEGQSKDSGLLHRELQLDPDWFDNGARTKTLLAIFDFDPSEFIWVLSIKLAPLKQISGFESKGWTTVSETNSKVSFRKGSVRIIVEPERITIDGLDIGKILDAGDKVNEHTSLVSTTLQLVGAKKTA